MYDYPIIYADQDFIVIDKPAGVPSAPLRPDDTENALQQAIERFPDMAGVTGRKPVEHGLVHRIDTATRGLLLIARTQNAYDAFQRIQAENRFFKEYEATCRQLTVCEETRSGFPPLPENVARSIARLRLGAEAVSFSVQSAFRFYGEGRTSVRPVTELASKFARKKSGDSIYTTEIVLSCISKDTVLAKCRISKGFRHQVRCHLAWCGVPVADDPLYAPALPETGAERLLQFYATALEFPHPSSGVPLRIELKQPSSGYTEIGGN